MNPEETSGPDVGEPAHVPTRRYKAFISYRHADNRDERRRWAEWLHRELETFPVPPDLVGKPNLRGESIPPSLYPVFRDEVELPADAELSNPIRHALSNSAHLVVLCSPRAVMSHYVGEEIKTFKTLGRSDRVLAVIIDGEPNASDTAKRAEGWDPAAECFPEALRTGVARADGSIDWTQRTEPIAADVRPGGRTEQGYTDAAAYRAALEASGAHTSSACRELEKEYASRLTLARLKVVSAILGVPLDTLSKRDAAYRAELAEAEAARLRAYNRRLTFAAGLIVVLIGLLAIGAILALKHDQSVFFSEVLQSREREWQQSVAEFLRIQEKPSKATVEDLGSDMDVMLATEYADAGRLAQLLGDAALKSRGIHAVWAYRPDGSLLFAHSLPTASQALDGKPIPTLDAAKLTALQSDAHFYFELPGAPAGGASPRLVEVRSAAIKARDSLIDGKPRILGAIFAGCLFEEDDVAEMTLFNPDDHIRLEPVTAPAPAFSGQTMTFTRALRDWKGIAVGKLVLWSHSRELADLESRGEGHLTTLVLGSIGLFSVLFLLVRRQIARVLKPKLAAQ